MLAPAGEGAHQRRGPEARERRVDAPRRAVERQVIDRRIEGLRVAPEDALTPARVRGELGKRPNVAVGDGERRVELARETL